MAILKNKEQLELAQQVMNACQDYITLAKAQAKLKNKTKVEELEIIIEETVTEINDKATRL